MTRPRLLFLCHTLPYPPDGGVAIRSFNVLRLLARAFDVDAICFARSKGGRFLKDVAASTTALRQYASVESFTIPQEGSAARLIWDHLRSVGRHRVYTRFVYESKGYEANLDAALRRERYDLVHVDSLDLARYLPKLSDLPVVCGHHNVESELLARRADAEGNWVRRQYLRFQSGLMAQEERTWCPRVALNVVVSREDEQTLQRLVPGAATAVVPNGVDTSHFCPREGPVEGVVFVGGLTWWPNRDALEFFNSRILPILRRAGVTAPVTWVGRSSATEQAAFNVESGVCLTGYVDDIRPHVRQAACYVVPLRVGGGTRLKILDAWAMGKAVVSTSVGCEGLEAKDGHNILIRDTPEAFAQAVQAVLGDAALRRALGEHARQTAEQHYDWEVIGSNMIARYLTLTERSDGMRRPLQTAPAAG